MLPVRRRLPSKQLSQQAALTTSEQNRVIVLETRKFEL